MQNTETTKKVKTSFPNMKNETRPKEEESVLFVSEGPRRRGLCATIRPVEASLLCFAPHNTTRERTVHFVL